MANLFFAVGLSLVLGILYAWGFRHLSRERWQFIGTIPIAKNSQGQWHGLNLTYYGLFNAIACALAVLIVYILLASAGISLLTIHLVLGMALAPCIPAAKLVARWVEKKAHTFSIGGAAFVGFMMTPWVLLLLNQLLGWWNLPTFGVMQAMAAISIAYAIGEGCGRLACISFGCCYGKPLSHLSPGLRKLLAPVSMTFHGHTKKIAYACSGAKTQVVPVQAITAILYSLAGVAGIVLFLQGDSGAAYLICVSVTQGWRFFSEFLRADYRGGGRISAYQAMALLALGYALVIFVVFPQIPFQGDIIEGLRGVWNPSIIILCQFLWIGIFLYMGRSQVTGSRITFHVRKDRI